jgi:recombination protein RecR
MTMAGSGYSAAVDRLIAALGHLPGIGAKSAERLAHHLLKCPSGEALELA